MLILPAIDLRGGQCVRLRQGDFGRETVHSSDPAALARRWADEGATYLHLVDLDGAREGYPVNGTVIRKIVETCGVRCQLGGGLREVAHIEQALGWGIARVVVGTRAIRDTHWLHSTCARFPGRVALGIDARDGRVATDGWLQMTECSAMEFARRCASWPLAAFIYTDIRRDGMLRGPNVDALRELATMTALPIIASGGISTLDDVRQVARLGLAGCIIGSALYENRLSLPEALQAVRQESSSSRTEEPLKAANPLPPDPRPLIPDP